MARWYGRAKAVLLVTFALLSPSTSFKLHPALLQKAHCQQFLVGLGLSLMSLPKPSLLGIPCALDGPFAYHSAPSAGGRSHVSDLGGSVKLPDPSTRCQYGAGPKWGVALKSWVNLKKDWILLQRNLGAKHEGMASSHLLEVYMGLPSRP